MNQRIQRVNQLIKKELSQIILREIGFPKNALVTITRVDSSPNLIQTKVYVSVIPEDKIEDVLEILEKSIYDLQQILNKRLNMRPVPKIKFVMEKETVEAGRIEELLEEIKKND